MKSFIPLLAVLIVLFNAACSPSSEETINFTIVQMNDVYEIASVQGGTKGGLARVATIVDSLKAENPNTILVIAGDFLGPSLLSNQKDSTGVKIYGAQMIEVLNQMGLDYTVFGNHEFDTKDMALLQARLDQADFTFICANAQRKLDDGKIIPFTQAGELVSAYVIHEFKAQSDTKLKLALVGTMLTENEMPYVHYDDPILAFEKAVAAANPIADVIIGLTHLNLGQDLELARLHPDLPLIMGGHEHHHIDSLQIRKAEANAKSIYVHNFTYNLHTGEVKVVSDLLPITDAIPEQAATKAIVDRWLQSQAQLLENAGIDSDQVIYTAATPLIGRDAVIRHQQTNLGDLILLSYEWAYPEADLYFFNSGAVRLDDDLSGAVTELDVARTLHFGDRIVQIQLPGKAVLAALNRGKKPRNGSFLQLRGVVEKDGAWVLVPDGKLIQADSLYKLVTRGYLAEGGDGYEMLKLGSIRENPQALSPLVNDERLTLIGYLEQLTSGKTSK